RPALVNVPVVSRHLCAGTCVPVVSRRRRSGNRPAHSCSENRPAPPRCNPSGAAPTGTAASAISAPDGFRRACPGPLFVPTPTDALRPGCAFRRLQVVRERDRAGTLLPSRRSSDLVRHLSMCRLFRGTCVPVLACRLFRGGEGPEIVRRTAV